MPSFIARVKVPGTHGPQRLGSLSVDAKPLALAFLRKHHPEMTDDGTVTADDAPEQIKLAGHELLAHLRHDFMVEPEERNAAIYVIFDRKKGGRRKTAKKSTRRRRTTRRR